MFIKLIRWLLSLFGFGPTPEPVVPQGTPQEESVMPVQNGRKKKAFLVGINDCGIPGAELNGCINDVEAMWEILVGTYGFEPDNIRMVTDSRATKEAIISRLEWVIDEASPGDEIFYHESSHGSQVRDRNGDELDDGLDEILIPYGHSWDNPLKDDDLATIFKKLPEGAFLTVVIDACHSGTATRGLPGNPGNPGKPQMKPRFLPSPIDIAARSWGRKIATRHIGAKKGTNGKGDNQRHILLSGCRDDQTSADAVINGKWGGALTCNLIKVLREHPDWDWNHVHEEVVKQVRDGGFTQVPQLSGMLSLRERVPFGGIG